MSTYLGEGPPAYTPAGAGRLPRLAPIRQRFDSSHVADIAAAVRESFGPVARESLQPGTRVAVTAGSRGIANIAEIVASMVREVRGLGAESFVVASMGSYGGASVEG